MVKENIRIWGIPNDQPAKFIGKYRRENIFPYTEMMEGREVNNDILAQIEFECDIEELVSNDVIYLNRGRLPIVSNRISALLSDYVGNSIQPIKTIINCADGVVLDYVIINVVGIYEILDMRKSIYETFSGTVFPSRFSKVSIAENSLETACIGRDLNVRSHIFLTNDLSVFLQNVSRNKLVFWEPEHILL